NVVKACEVCRRCNGRLSKQTVVRKYPLPQNPWDVAGMDLLGPLPQTSSGNAYVLCITDYLTRFSVIVPIRVKRAYTIAEALRIHLFGPFGCPRELISDNAAEFTGEVMKSLCARY
ncbi:Ribonuclease H-like domain, partial [Trinorchestia longiramus]